MTELHTEGPWKPFSDERLRRLQPIRTELPERTHEFGVQIRDPNSQRGLRIPEYPNPCLEIETPPLMPTLPGTGRFQSYSTPEQDAIRRGMDIVRDDERDKIIQYLITSCSDVLEETIKDLQQGKHR